MRGKIVFLILLLLAALIITPFIYGQSKDEQKRDLEGRIKEYEQKLTELRAQKSTLASQIQYMDTQIYLTTLKTQETEQKIISTEKEIELLDSKIDGLDTSLDYLSKLLIERVVDGYKNQGVTLLDLLLDSDNAGDLVNRFKYLKTVENNNQKVLIQVQEAKLNFEEQKQLREKKVVELDQLKVTLAAQKADLLVQQESKRQLLATTQNDERTYQNLLSKAKAEYNAIQGIIAGAGTETRLRDVSKGETIASIIQGASCNSSGTHLHFIVQEGGSVRDPFNYLKSVDNVNESGGDSFNPSGSWDWPIPPTIHLHQGYGVTWFVRTYGWYSFHNGIDITGSSSSVVAVADGTLYRGSYSGGGGCALPYVKVTHRDSNMSTLYLHVYSN